ncbi:MAG: hypothetical protein ISS72_10230 [Candidatus Brocadiae bacterium]|nr:hypothetical protein [Candidatus Brocadiia bacterium]
MRRALWLALAPGVLVVLAVVFVISLFLVKILWAWTVPDLFPKAVEQGLVAGEISWFTALKVAIFIAVLSGITGLRGKKSSS